MILSLLFVTMTAFGQVESGTYSYDASGNIIAIGSDAFFYDKMSRLKRATVRGVTESYDYDAYGNRNTPSGALNCVEMPCATLLSALSATNRVSGASYDAAGNMTSGLNAESYAYDGTGMMTKAVAGSDDREFIYTADDERIAVKQGLSWTWTVRDQGARVLREFTSASQSSTSLVQTNRQWAKDYVYRAEGLVATVSPSGTYHYHLDHLGTPRLVTNSTHTTVGEHAYYPFGPEINLTPHESPETRMKFTGHERDVVAGGGHTLDYMHARFYSPAQGRFLSPDPLLGQEQHPQSWNRYTYAENNPVNKIDPDGRDAIASFIMGIVGGPAASERYKSVSTWQAIFGNGAQVRQAYRDTPKLIKAEAAITLAALGAAPGPVAAFLSPLLGLGHSSISAPVSSTAVSRLRFTSEGETFIRYESGNPDYSRITPQGAVRPGTFAAPVSDGVVPLERRAATYQLPNPEIPRTEVKFLRPPAGTVIEGPRPVSGGPGNEVIFPFGAPPGSVGPPPLTPPL